MTNPIQETQRLGQSIWNGNIRRALFESGELQKPTEAGAGDLTSNSTIFPERITPLCFPRKPNSNRAGWFLLTHSCLVTAASLS